MNLYTHVGMTDQATAINVLPTPPALELLEDSASRPFAQGFAKKSASDGIDGQSVSPAVP